MRSPFILIILVLSILLLAGSVNAQSPNLDEIAGEYLRILLCTEQWDDDIVDAYYGPELYKPVGSGVQSKADPPYDSLVDLTKSLMEQLELPENGTLDTPRSRGKHLHAQLRALHTRLRILRGEKLPFDTESKLIYDVIVPRFKDSYFDSIVARIDSLVPGEGDLFGRWRRYQDRYLVPSDKRETVLKRAIEELQRRTLEHLDLPLGEKFDLELVHDVSWGAYNWYQGNYHSLIQYNADSPMRLTSAVGLAAHEGYPGHHVAGIIQDSILYRQNGWVEFSIVPLFSPTSVFSEGLANYSVDLAMPRQERIRFESEILCPLAGVDSTGLGLYYELSDLFKELGWASQVAARDYVDKKKSASETMTWLSRYSSSGKNQLARSVRFYEQYRAYNVTYNMGERLIEEYMNRVAPNDPVRQWELLLELYSQPVVPSDLNE